MGIADDVKKLGEDIVASYDTRVKAIGVLVKDTHKMLKGFQAEHKEMAASLKTDLAKGEETRLKDFKAMMESIHKFVSNVVKDVNALIKKFHQAHKAMADELRKNLDKGEADRIKAFKPMIAGIQKEIKDIENYVAKKLKEFDEVHADMSEELKKMLMKYVNDMIKATQQLMSDIQKRQKERNGEVSDLLEAYEAEREKMAHNWEALTIAMAKKRSGKVSVTAETKIETVGKTVTAKKPAVKKHTSKKKVVKKKKSTKTAKKKK